MNHMLSFSRAALNNQLFPTMIRKWLRVSEEHAVGRIGCRHRILAGFSIRILRVVVNPLYLRRQE